MIKKGKVELAIRYFFKRSLNDALPKWLLPCHTQKAALARTVGTPLK